MIRRSNQPNARVTEKAFSVATPCLALALEWLLITAPALAETIRPADALAHVGQTVTVEGTVSEVYTARRSDVTFLDMVGRYPDEAFTGVIFAEDTGAFPNVLGKKGSQRARPRRQQFQGIIADRPKSSPSSQR